MGGHWVQFLPWPNLMTGLYSKEKCVFLRSRSSYRSSYIIWQHLLLFASKPSSIMFASPSNRFLSPLAFKSQLNPLKNFQKWKSSPANFIFPLEKIFQKFFRNFSKLILAQLRLRNEKKCLLGLAIKDQWWRLFTVLIVIYYVVSPRRS